MSTDKKGMFDVPDVLPDPRTISAIGYLQTLLEIAQEQVRSERDYGLRSDTRSIETKAPGAHGIYR